MSDAADFLAAGRGRTYRASAPGRLDVMGGVADYSGSLLLQMPIAERTAVALRRDDGERIELYSTHGDSRAAVPLGLLRAAVAEGRGRTGPLAYAGFRQNLHGDGAPDWTRYVLGCLVLGAARGHWPLEGLRVFVDSEVPVGQGLSSSAALEVATLRALATAYAVDFPGTALPVLAQAVENDVVGAPCGLMDQLASHLGVAGALLPLRCEPEVWVGEPLALPAGIRFERHPSGVEHAVGGDAYGRARCAAFMGRRILETDHDLAPGSALAEVDADEFSAGLEPTLPAELRGADFLARYGESPDPQTAIVPERMYPVRAATAHPVYEHRRIRRFAETLRRARREGRALTAAELRRLGEAMTASHRSYTAIGLGHPATDALVAILLAQPDVYGARVTGGGVGGTVVALASTQR